MINLKKNNMEDIKEILTCNICFDTIRLPSKFIPTIECQSHKNHTIFDKVFCYNCLNDYLHSSYYQFLKHPQGCNCELDTRKDIKIKHSTELWNILDVINDGKTFCEFCNINCGTQQTYYRHINDKLTSNDSVNEACPEVNIKCPHCNFRGKRKIVNGDHYDQVHNVKFCKICNKNIPKISFDSDFEKKQNYLINKLNEF